MKRAIPLIGLAVVAVMLPVFYASHKRSETNGAIAILNDWGTTTAAQEAALTVLRKDKDATTTKALIAIVFSPRTRPDTRKMVVPVLAARHDPAIPEALSERSEEHTS